MKTLQTSPKGGNTDPTAVIDTASKPSIKADRRMPNTGGWQDRHDLAVKSLIPCEYSIVSMAQGWALYAQNQKRRHGSSIGEDYVLGPEWAQIGKGILGLLNGETGRLDCGTVDGFIRDTFKANGFNDEGEALG